MRGLDGPGPACFDGENVPCATLPRGRDVVWAVVFLPGLLSAGRSDGLGAEPPPARPLGRAADLRLDLEGPARNYLDAVTRNWLLPAPRANPAILAMFADRDRTPVPGPAALVGRVRRQVPDGGDPGHAGHGRPARCARTSSSSSPQLVAFQDTDGYLGPFSKGHRLTGSAPNIGGKAGGTWDAWGHYHTMLGLLLWHEATGDPAALAAARRIGDLFCDRFLGDKHPRLVDTGSTEMNLAPAHGLCLLAEKTGEKRYLELARQIVDEFAAVDPKGQPLAGDYFRRGLAGRGVLPPAEAAVGEPAPGACPRRAGPDQRR